MLVIKAFHDNALERSRATRAFLNDATMYIGKPRYSPPDLPAVKAGRGFPYPLGDWPQSE